MLVRIDYKESPYFRVDNISIVGSFPSFDAEECNMQRNTDGWYISLNLDPGEYVYRFLINDVIHLCDPMSNSYVLDESGEIWSVLAIDEDGQRRYDTNEKELTMNDYAIWGSIVEEEEEIPFSKKRFNLWMDEKVVVRFGFTNITGTHEVSMLWFEPTGKIYTYSQNSLIQGETEKPIYLWFWIDLSEINRSSFEGTWTLKVFIDGDYILEDQIMINSGVIYQRYGSNYGINTQ